MPSRSKRSCSGARSIAAIFEAVTVCGGASKDIAKN